MKSKRNLWPYGIILAFVIFVSGTAGLIVMACSQKSDLIDENYYEQEIRYQGRIDSQERAKQLATPATIKYDEAKGVIAIALPAQQAGATGRITLYRPSEATLDQSIALSLDANCSQTIDATKLQPGLWKVRITWTAQKQEYSVDQKVVVKRS